MTSPSLSAKRSRAGRKGADRRWSKSPDTLPAPSPPPASTRSSRLDVDPAVSAQLEKYIKLVGMPTDWSDIKILESVRAEIVRTQQATHDLKLSRGSLWTSAQVSARDERWNHAVADRIDLVERLMDLVEVGPDQRRAFLDAAREWRLETRRVLAKVHH